MTKQDTETLDGRVVSPSDTIIAYKNAAVDPDMQIVFADLVRTFGFARGCTFAKAGGDPTKNVYYSGQRSVCVHIGNMIDADPMQADLAGKQVYDENTGVERDVRRETQEPFDFTDGDV